MVSLEGQCKRCFFFFSVPVVVVVRSAPPKKDRFEGIASPALSELQRPRRPPGRVARVTLRPPWRGRGAMKERKREKKRAGGEQNENAFALPRWQEEKKKKSPRSQSSLFHPKATAPPLSLPRFSPLLRARGSKSKQLKHPYRKSSGICCTACSRTTNRHPFFCFAFLDSPERGFFFFPTDDDRRQRREQKRERKSKFRLVFFSSLFSLSLLSNLNLDRVASLTLPPPFFPLPRESLLPLLSVSIFSLSLSLSIYKKRNDNDNETPRRTEKRKKPFSSSSTTFKKTFPLSLHPFTSSNPFSWCSCLE